MDLAASTERYAAALAPYRELAASDPQGLANHLPMALSALAAMGAPAERLAAFARVYVERHALQPMDAEERGVRDAIAVTPPADVIAGLWTAFGTSAFHGAIRTAYGFERGDGAEVVAGLAAWRRNRFVVDVAPPADAVPRDPRDALLALGPVYDALHLPNRGFITTRMATVVGAPAFAAALAPAPRAAGLPRLLLLLAAAFGASRNFVALHALTGTHALATLLPLARDPDAAVAAAWPSIAAAFVIAGAPALPDAEELEGMRAVGLPAWELLLEAATSSDDDHVVKATSTCWRLGTSTNDDVYRWAAMRYVPLPTEVAP